MSGIFLKKIGMMQVFREDGVRVPVTVLQKDVCHVVGHKTLDRDGYLALRVGVGAATRRVSKPVRGVFAKSSVNEARYIREIRVQKADDLQELGAEINVDIFTADDLVDVSAVSKGNGFSGVIKRHNFGGMRASHGVSVSHRAHGSTGQNQDPGRVFKGKKMAGQCGNKRVTVQNLKVFSFDKERGVLMLCGGVPGPAGQYVMVKKAVKS